MFPKFILFCVERAGWKQTLKRHGYVVTFRSKYSETGTNLESIFEFSYNPLLIVAAKPKTSMQEAVKIRPEVKIHSEA